MQFQGTVTQSGVMNDGHSFRAEQDIELNFVLGINDEVMLDSVFPDEQPVKCIIVRTERKKFVDESHWLSPELPLYLQCYLSSFGSCREETAGVWVQSEGLIMLKGRKDPVVLGLSDVTWSRHCYILSMEADGALLGVVINPDSPSDRVENQGHLNARLCNKKIMQCLLRKQIQNINTFPFLMALRLPVSVYRFDVRSKQYVFQACFQFTMCCAPMPEVLTSRASQSMLSENLELLKTAMRAPAVILQKGTKVRIYNVSCEEVSSFDFSNVSLIHPNSNATGAVASTNRACEGDSIL